MWSLSLLEGCLVLFQVAVVDEETKQFADRHSHGLHVGMVEIALASALGDSLTAHKFVGWMRDELPNVPTSPEMKKKRTAELPGLRSQKGIFIGLLTLI